MPKPHTARRKKQQRPNATTKMAITPPAVHHEEKSTSPFLEEAEDTMTMIPARSSSTAVTSEIVSFSATAVDVASPTMMIPARLLLATPLPRAPSPTASDHRLKR